MSAVAQINRTYRHNGEGADSYVESTKRVRGDELYYVALQRQISAPAFKGTTVRRVNGGDVTGYTVIRHRRGRLKL